MRYILILFFVITSCSAYSQGNYKLTTHDTLLNREARLEKFAISGLPKRKTQAFRRSTLLIRGDLLKINKAFFDEKIVGRWSDKKYHLSEIEILPSGYPHYLTLTVHFIFKKDE